MTFLASLVVHSLAVFVPQDPAAPATPSQDRPALLTPAEQSSLRDKVVKYLDAEDAYGRAEKPGDRDKAARNKEKAKDALDKEWAQRGKKGNLLASMADLRAIYDNCFVVPAPKQSPGTMKKEKLKDSKFEYTVYLPKGYKADKPMRTMLVLPGTSGAEPSSAWTEGERYFESVWDKTTLINDTIVHVSHIPAGMEMDVVPDFSRDGQDAQERDRIAAVFQSFGATTNALNVDRSRLFLDCGRGNCGFGLRFVSMFPDRFAGVVLRSPIAVDGLRLGSLLGIPVLMIKTAANAAVVDKLKSRLEEITPGSVTIVDATDEYPHKAAASAIETWMQKLHRNMCPSHVLIEPNHDQFNRAYWVRPGSANPLHTSTAETKARIEVTADRASNRIVVKARSIESFQLLLNDDLVDLDKEFTVVINDKAVTEKRTRDQRRMQDQLVQRRDWEFLFTVAFDATVPKPSTNGDKPATGEGGGGK